MLLQTAEIKFTLQLHFCVQSQDWNLGQYTSKTLPPTHPSIFFPVLILFSIYEFEMWLLGIPSFFLLHWMWREKEKTKK